MVTHDQEEALTMADRIVVMNHGVIEQVGTPTEIYREPGTLFVADFIGAMNKVAGQATSNNEVMIGQSTLVTNLHKEKPNEPVTVTIRPEDIIPYGKAESSLDAPDRSSPVANTFRAVVEEMEFLGSFWRISLNNDALGDIKLTADMSINAVRRIKITSGDTITVELPAECIQVFSRDDGNA
jgi:iron(III) transport system ATP-binding protein